MKETHSRIPTSKVARATRFVRTGFKVGGNYLKYYSRKAVDPNTDRESLDRQNAKAVYGTLSELKGSALKVAQMLSMDQGVLPAPFAEQFAQAQHKAPPLSGPLVVKTFKQYVGISPMEMFDEFDLQAAHAASIGQVHKARKNGQDLAVKIQYPGVGDSVISDLNIAIPLARQLLGWKDQDLSAYIEEVKTRLLEETDYELELERSAFISEKCGHLPNLFFARYYPKWSGARVITMDWLEGLHLEEFLASRPSQATKNQVGQALWDFYQYQLHELQLMHADAHPGNFLFRTNGQLGVLDFGCVKEIPSSIYRLYLQLISPHILEDKEAFLQSCLEAGIVQAGDEPRIAEMMSQIFRDALQLVCKPFHVSTFDFGDKAYFNTLYEYGSQTNDNKELRKLPPRGSEDFMYLNRAFFGLYSLLHQLGAEVHTQRFLPAAIS